MAGYLQPLSPDPAVSRGPHHVRGLRGAARAGDLPAVPRGAGGAAVQEPRAGGARQENLPAGGGGEQKAAGRTGRGGRRRRPGGGAEVTGWPPREGTQTAASEIIPSRPEPR